MLTMSNLCLMAGPSQFILTRSCNVIPNFSAWLAYLFSDLRRLDDRLENNSVTVRLVVVDEIGCGWCPSADVTSPDHRRRDDAERGRRDGSRWQHGDQQRPSSTERRRLVVARRVDAYAHRVEITATRERHHQRLSWTTSKPPRNRQLIVLFVQETQLIVMTS